MWGGAFVLGLLSLGISCGVLEQSMSKALSSRATDAHVEIMACRGPD